MEYVTLYHITKDEKNLDINHSENGTMKITINRSPKGDTWSALPLSCSSYFMIIIKLKQGIGRTGDKVS